MRRPYEGVKVLDLSTMLAASSCSRIFAEWGADVIKIEAPKGDLYRFTTNSMGAPIYADGDPLYDEENCNKSFVALDLKSSDGMGALMKMLETADVLVTNYRENALKKLGIDYDSLKVKFPKLIYAWAGGYGSKGPEKDKGAFDYTTFYARSGILQDLTERGHPPLNPVSGLGDHVAGLCLALAAATALYARSVTGKGDRVEASLYQAGLYVTICGPLTAAGGKQWPRSRYEANQITSNTYKCKDDTWIFLSQSVSWNERWPVLCEKVFKRPELAKDERFMPQTNAIKHVDEGAHILDEIFAEHDYEYWAKLLRENDVPFEKCVHFSEVFSDEQAAANEYFTEYTYPSGDKIKLARAPAKFNSMPELIKLSHAKKPGGDTREVLKKYGYSDDDITRMNEAGSIKAL